jgi:hypothetical protein
MRSTLIAVCIVIVGTYAPGESVRQQFQHAPAQAQAVWPQRQAQTELDRQGTPPPDIRRGNASVTANSAVARRRAESHRPSSGPATGTQPPQPGNRQLPGAVGLLLALALLNGAGPAPQETPQPAIN